MPGARRTRIPLCNRDQHRRLRQINTTGKSRACAVLIVSTPVT